MVFLDIKIVNISTKHHFAFGTSTLKFMKLTILVENFIAFQNVRSFFSRIKDKDFLTLDLLTHVQYDHFGPDIPDVQK